MGEFEDPNVIDGLSSVLAVRRAQRRAVRMASGQEAKNVSSSAQQSTIPRPIPATPRIAQCVIPDKFEVVCYECGYSFPMTGQLKETVCPKCRNRLKPGNHVIDKEWTAPIRTIGDVEITRSGLIRGADIIARDVIMRGASEYGSVRACRILDLHPTAKISVGKLQAGDMIVRSGGCFAFGQAINCRNLTIESGSQVHAIIFAEGTISVKAGALLTGEADCMNLLVEDGAGLEAHVCAGSRRSKPTAGFSQNFRSVGVFAGRS